MSSETGFSYKITRTLEAPVEKVWRVWTVAADHEQWAYAVPGSVEMDVRPGGSWKSVIETPDGDQFPITGTYGEVVENQRLEQIMDIPGGEPQAMDMVLTGSGDTTTVTVTQTCPTAEERDQAEEGTAMLLDSCAEYLAKI